MNNSNGSDERADSRVGYRNPPKHSRFKKGQSGNTRGRPKGTLNMASVLERTLRERVTINEGGRRKSVTKLQAAIKQLSDQATAGNLRALRLLASLVLSAEERGRQQPPEPNSNLNEIDEKVFLGILQRLEASGKGEKNETDTQ